MKGSEERRGKGGRKRRRDYKKRNHKTFMNKVYVLKIPTAERKAMVCRFRREIRLSGSLSRYIFLKLIQQSELWKVF